MPLVPNILIVDDNPVNLLILEKTLAPLQAHVVKASHGDEALRLTLDQDFALAILDVCMPLMDGYELAQLLRGDARTQNIPIIFLSAMYSDALHLFKGYQSGAVDFITKPFNPDVLLCKVQIFLEMYQLSQRSIEHSRELEVLLATQKCANDDLNCEIAVRQQAEQALQRAKEAAEQAREQWEQTFNTVPDLIMLIDPDYRILRANRSILERLGSDHEGVVGQLCYELLHGLTAPPDYCPHTRLLTTGEEAQCAFVEERLGGAFDVSATPIRDASGKIVCSVYVMHDINELKAAEARLQELATTDGLTGLHNRRHFLGQLAGEFERAKRYGLSLAFLMIDADNFKAVNDTYGHETGDSVLCLLAETLRQCLRNIDIAGRLGGEEFAILLPETAMEGAMLAAERIRAAMENSSVPTRAGACGITVSIGVAMLTPEVTDPGNLIRHADLALYQAKDLGRNRVVLHGALPETCCDAEACSTCRRPPA